MTYPAYHNDSAIEALKGPKLTIFPNNPSYIRIWLNKGMVEALSEMTVQNKEGDG